MLVVGDRSQGGVRLVGIVLKWQNRDFCSIGSVQYLDWHGLHKLTQVMKLYRTYYTQRKNEYK